MAMELWVLSDQKLNSIMEWQSAIDAASFPLKLSDESSIDQLGGFLPARLGGQSTGFECSHWSAVELIRSFPGVDFGHEWKFALAFRWRGDFTESRAAWIAGAAYAEATKGVVFDDQEKKIRNAEQACETARREYEASAPDVPSAIENINKEDSNTEAPLPLQLTISVRVF